MRHPSSAQSRPLVASWCRSSSPARPCASRNHVPPSRSTGSRPAPNEPISSRRAATTTSRRSWPPSTRPRTLVHVTSFGYSFEGRTLPLAVVGRVADARPATVKASGKLRVYLQANIHAGEVEGKEAVLALIRDIAQGQLCRLAELDGAAREPHLQRRRQREGDAHEPRLPARPDRRPGHACQCAGAQHQPRQHQDRDAGSAVDGAARSTTSTRTSWSTCTPPTAHAMPIT